MKKQKSNTQKRINLIQPNVWIEINGINKFCQITYKMFTYKNENYNYSIRFDNEHSKEDIQCCICEDHNKNRSVTIISLGKVATKRIYNNINDIRNLMNIFIIQIIKKLGSFIYVYTKQNTI